MSNPFAADPMLQAILMACDEQAMVRVELNDVLLWWPAGTILTMTHCVQRRENGGLELRIETAHLDWLRAHLTPGAIFLDVGAATGAMTVPIAARYPGVQIIAFEPAERVRRLLRATLTRNGLEGVKIKAQAVSNRDGQVRFADRRASQDGSTPFLPETSTLVADDVMDDPYGEVRLVETTRLDTVAEEFGITGRRVVMKIDIEGYEKDALLGASGLLTRNECFIAIDIHTNPDGSGSTTENSCRDELMRIGYDKLMMSGHVLLASRSGG